MITAKQRERQMNGVGASTLPSLFDLDPRFSCAERVISWINKEPFELNIDPVYLRQCEHVEESAIAWWEEHNDCRILRNQYRHKKGAVLFADLDGLEDAGKYNLEVKVSGIAPGRVTEDWGDPETDQMPARVKIQCWGQQATLDPPPEYTVVLAVLPGYGRLYTPFVLPYDAEMAGAMNDRANFVWNEYVLKKKIPPKSNISIEFQRKMPRTKGSIANDEIPADLVTVLETARRQRAYWEKTLEAVEFDIHRIMDGSELARIEEDADRHLSFTIQGAGGVPLDSAKLKVEYPDAYKACKVERTTRILRVKKGQP